jgi:hypothetical protein
MRSNVTVAAATLVAVLVASAPSRGLFAQTAPGAGVSASQAEAEARKRDAKAKFLQGRAALNRGEYATALVFLRTSQELYPSPGTLLNLALCEERLGMLGSAIGHFQEVMRLLPQGDERQSIAKHGATMLEQRVPRLRIELAKGAPEGTTVARGGAPVQASDFGKDLPVDPGKHVVVATAPGRPDRSYEVALVEGARGVLSVEPGPAPEPPKAVVIEPAPAKKVEAARANPRAPPSGEGRASGGDDPRVAEPDDATSSRRTAAFIVGGVGIVGIGVGAITGALAFTKKSDVDELCPREDTCILEGVEAEQSGKRLATASTIAFAVGIAGVGVGAVLLITSGSSSKRATAIGPIALPGGAGVGARGRF